MTIVGNAPRHGVNMREPALYCVGFAFDRQRRPVPRVLLIEKQRPAWQKGKLNGVGGKLKRHEEPEAAMRREFQEETGLYVRDWSKFATLKGPDFFVTFFRAFLTPEEFELAQTTTDEPVVECKVFDIWTLPVIPNLPVLIPLALDESGLKLPVDFIDLVPAAT